MTEAERQQAVLHALASGAPHASGTPAWAGWGLCERGERAEQGWQAYMGHRDASAERALHAAFGTVRALVGVQDFGHLARAFWRDHPPSCGDLAQWGEPFAAWLQQHPALAQWPWLGDCARLDWAVHHNERACDARLELDTLSALDRDDPERLWMELMPGSALLSSRWPIVSVYDAHHGPGADEAQVFERVGQALRAERAEHAWVVREGWRAAVHRVDAPTARFLRGVLDGVALGGAVAAAGPAFDFAQWLGDAVARAWVKGVRCERD